MSSFQLQEPRPTPVAMPAPRLTSARMWREYSLDGLRSVRAAVDRVIDEQERQGDLFAEPAPSLFAPAPAAAPAAAGDNPLGAVLSPSQVRKFLDCSAAWWFKYGAGLPDPRSGNQLRGTVVHKMAEAYFKAKLKGQLWEPELMGDFFESTWAKELRETVLGKHEDAGEIKAQAARLGRKYLDEVAFEIEPAAVEQSVTGEIGGVSVRGFLDVIDTAGRIIDLKTAGRKPAGVDPGYAFQVATYRQLAPGASGEVRLDTLWPPKPRNW